MVYEEVEHEGEGPHVVTGPVAVTVFVVVANNGSLAPSPAPSAPTARDGSLLWDRPFATRSTETRSLARGIARAGRAKDRLCTRV